MCKETFLVWDTTVICKEITASPFSCNFSSVMILCCLCGWAFGGWWCTRCTSAWKWACCAATWAACAWAVCTCAWACAAVANWACGLLLHHHGGPWMRNQRARRKCHCSDLPANKTGKIHPTPQYRYTSGTLMTSEMAPHFFFQVQ